MLKTRIRKEGNKILRLRGCIDYGRNMLKAVLISNSYVVGTDQCFLNNKQATYHILLKK